MNKQEKEFLIRWADRLEQTVREGAETDGPEGARYIRISHTLAMEAAQAFRCIAGPTGWMEAK